MSNWVGMSKWVGNFECVLSCGFLCAFCSYGKTKGTTVILEVRRARWTGQIPEKSKFWQNKLGWKRCRKWARSAGKGRPRPNRTTYGETKGTHVIVWSGSDMESTLDWSGGVVEAMLGIPARGSFWGVFCAGWGVVLGCFARSG
jgi:hypothetical protein